MLVRFIAVCVLVATAALAYDFPALTGRVVDGAHMLSPATIQQLDSELADFERQSGDQVVVATVPSLQGSSIEDYGYQLGRAWGIGQKGKDNGVILIVAPNERKVRIEVGYGLEGTLTDALSHEIIQDDILPAFRQGRMESGVVAGAGAIITALGGHVTGAPVVYHAAQGQPINWVVIVLVLLFFVLRIFILPWWFPTFLPFGGGSGSGGFGGGFSGGGGSFGGGGASGSW